MLAHRPPTGRNSRNTFGKDINEKLIIEVAGAPVEKAARVPDMNTLLLTTAGQ